ncbi:MAG: hypothetical protein MR418_13045 [Clostridiales bacterium]|nr:hypothetical protein [Clostridiales bacterium]
MLALAVLSITELLSRKSLSPLAMTALITASVAAVLCLITIIADLRSLKRR